MFRTHLWAHCYPLAVRRQPLEPRVLVDFPELRDNCGTGQDVATVIVIAVAANTGRWNQGADDSHHRPG